MSDMREKWQPRLDRTRNVNGWRYWRGPRDAPTAPDIEDLLAEIDRLTAALERHEQWKREAMFVLGEWERVFDAAGKPGKLGESKALATLAALAERDATIAELTDEVDRLIDRQGESGS